MREGKLTRGRLCHYIRQRGWNVRHVFDAENIGLEVTGAVNGIPFVFRDRVPFRVEEEHQDFFDRLHDRIFYLLS